VNAYAHTPQYMVLSSRRKPQRLWLKILFFFRRGSSKMPDMASPIDPPSWQAAAEILGALLPHLPIAGRLQEYRVWEVWEGDPDELPASATGNRVL